MSFRRKREYIPKITNLLKEEEKLIKDLDTYFAPIDNSTTSKDFDKKLSIDLSKTTDRLQKIQFELDEIENHLYFYFRKKE